MRRARALVLSLAPCLVFACLVFACLACGELPADRDFERTFDTDLSTVAPADNGDAGPGASADAAPLVPEVDSDDDGVFDAVDNCPDTANPNQLDFDEDGVGDACTAQQGTVAAPLIISPAEPSTVVVEQRDTSQAISDAIDSYPPATADESGAEVIYAFRVKQAVHFAAEIRAPEPSGVDVDVHLLSGIEPPVLIARDDLAVTATLEPGRYYLVVDSFKGKVGKYTLDVSFRPRAPAPADTFNSYLLRAVEQLEASHGLLGYGAAALTHDLAYGGHGTIKATNPPKTMCVAAVLEVIVTAMQIYADETGDSSVFDFLPKRSFDKLSGDALRAHIWVNHDLNTSGTADALRHFGMGINVPFSELTPGSLVNINRTTGTGHAVIFLAFIDGAGKEHERHNSSVIGFKYFSSQGGSSAGSGGFDYRYAVFEQHGAPQMPYKRDLHVIYSEEQHLLNTGIMFAPSSWLRTSWSGTSGAFALPLPLPQLTSRFDPVYFDGVTADD